MHCVECHTPLSMNADQFKTFVRVEAGCCPACLEAIKEGYYKKQQMDTEKVKTDAFITAIQQHRDAYVRGVAYPWYESDISLKTAETIAKEYGYQIEYFCDPENGRTYYRYKRPTHTTT